MRIACAVLLFSLVTSATGSADTEEFPYAAFIRSSDVQVRSGPNETYYATDRLQRGERVDVYRHDPDGWCAIRPPAGSFSWVAARHLDLKDDNMAEVIDSQVVAFVGSKFSDVHDVRQVHLDRGEFVEVVGEKRLVEPEEGFGETWYKIAPPSGEFRWVSARELARDRDDAKTVRKSGHSRNAQASWAASAPGGVRVAAEQAPLEDRGEQVRFADGTLQDAATPRPINSDRLDLELSMIVAEPASKWDFADIRTRAEDRVRTAPTALQRGRARLVLGEIARFEKLQKQYVEAGQRRPQIATVEPAVAENPSDEPDKPDELAANSDRPAQKASTDLASYDGVGRLTPVVSKKPGAPKFALTDMKGNVLMFVTPAIGVDLSPHVGKVVGLSGARGFMPKLRKTHLSASQVERLEPTALLALRPRR